ncbi:hypothetical protein TWF718_009232 [Orbilia javanica]|uniref:F-box domain-containing protein n=1 Tax=Orbilia javanica TaxID=47235 RepID=A0AAN8NSL9_9PEZI
MITDIPIEILKDIFGYIPKFDRNLGDLRTCCLVNKFFHSLATPALYRHLELALLTNGQGFEEHVTRSLLSQRYSSHRFIRHISIKFGGFQPSRSAKISMLHDGDDRFAVHIAAFIESLPVDQIQSISCEALSFLKFLPSSYYPKIKDLECYIDVNVYVLSRKTTFFPSLQTLTFRETYPHIPGLGTEWSICRKYRETLKSLSLEAGPPEAVPDPDITFPKNPYLEAQELQNLRLLNFESLKLGGASIFSLIPVNNLKRLELINCYIHPSLLVEQAPNFTNLTDLAVHPKYRNPESIYTSWTIEKILLNLPKPLQSLQWTQYSPDQPSEYPSKMAIQRHSATLKKLWLEISYYAAPNDMSAGKPSHYFRETTRRMVEIPVKATLEENVDLETLSKFPNLEHLVVPIEAPKFPKSWIPSFPNLRSLYFVNSCKVYSSLARPPTKCFRQEWINWFMSADDLECPDGANYSSMSIYHRHPRLQLIAFQRPANIWETTSDTKGREPGSRGFTAHMRDSDNPGYFSKEAMTSETVRHIFPDVWEFFKGYFMVENKRYVYPTENTNLAKGVFEDEDESKDLPKMLMTGPHALQDYQTQLLLLENQNKRRLMMARAEQEILRECPIELPKFVNVGLLRWGVEKNPEFEDAVVKSLQEYQQDIVSFDEQMKKREEYLAVRMEEYLASAAQSSAPSLFNMYNPTPSV